MPSATSDDIVERLRAASIFDSWPRELFIKAADEIERLRKEVHLCRNVLPAHIAKALYEGEG